MQGIGTVEWAPISQSVGGGNSPFFEECTVAQLCFRRIIVRVMIIMVTKIFIPAPALGGFKGSNSIHLHSSPLL